MYKKKLNSSCGTIPFKSDQTKLVVERPCVPLEKFLYPWINSQIKPFHFLLYLVYSICRAESIGLQQSSVLERMCKMYKENLYINTHFERVQLLTCEVQRLILNLAAWQLVRFQD